MQTDSSKWLIFNKCTKENDKKTWRESCLMKWHISPWSISFFYFKLAECNCLRNETNEFELYFKGPKFIFLNILGCPFSTLFWWTNEWIIMKSNNKSFLQPWNYQLGTISYQIMYLQFFIKDCYGTKPNIFCDTFILAPYNMFNQKYNLTIDAAYHTPITFLSLPLVL